VEDRIGLVRVARRDDGGTTRLGARGRQERHGHLGPDERLVAEEQEDRVRRRPERRRPLHADPERAREAAPRVRVAEDMRRAGIDRGEDRVRIRAEDEERGGGLQGGRSGEDVREDRAAPDGGDHLAAPIARARPGGEDDDRDAHHVRMVRGGAPPAEGRTIGAMSDRPTNRLAGETSPYLLQHAHNPVDWYPWGPEAFARAQAEDRPILLSVGYAACHWCHVMERESFEDATTAQEMNASFVAVKVDREERPDVDALHMEAVQALTGSGGWPMTVFLTPEGKPFHGGTYYPPVPHHGLPSFRQLLAAIDDAWRTDRARVLAAADRLADAIGGSQLAPATLAARVATHDAEHAGEETRAGGPLGLILPPGVTRAPDEGPLRSAVAALAERYDARRGHWGRAPRFPQPMTIELLLREHARTGDARALAMARGSLDTMAAGGIRDHLGGGFARYATDDAWLIPHFEKMLYDNAQLARVYLHGWRVTGSAADAEVVTETLGWMARELRVGTDGAFAAALDADTEGEEGATYTWDQAEIQAVLGEAAPLFAAAYGVTEGGNWEGRTILSRVRDDAALAATFGIAREAVAGQVAAARERLLAVRDGRPQPARDDKVLAAWNGLALQAFAEAGCFLPDGERWTRIADAVADDLLAHLVTPEGRLRRSWKDGRALHDGMLEDHAALGLGLLALYETTFDARRLTAARTLATLIVTRFAADDGGFHDTADDAERLFARPRNLGDNATPSGNAHAATFLLRLAALTGESELRSRAADAVIAMAPIAARYPTGYAQWLIAYALVIDPPAELAIVGDPADPATRALLAVARGARRPDLVIACAADPEASGVPLLADRTAISGRPTAYLCRDFACRAPVTDADALARLLAAEGAR